MPEFTRISGRRGSVVNLDVDFYKGGQLADPILYRVEIFRGKVTPENIVAAFQLDEPESSSYPLPVVQLEDSSGPIAGKFRLPWLVPDDLVVPDTYFDTWFFFTSDPRSGSGDTLENHQDELIEACHRFFVYPDEWHTDPKLQTIRFGYEPLDQKFHKPEVRPLEVGVMPLPLYDFDFNLIVPMIPFMQATISIETENCESLVEDEPMEIKLRQGAYRTNPFVFSYLLDTSQFLIGTYRYRITTTLPCGTTRVSPTFIFTISGIGQRVGT